MRDDVRVNVYISQLHFFYNSMNLINCGISLISFSNIFFNILDKLIDIYLIYIYLIFLDSRNTFTEYIFLFIKSKIRKYLFFTSNYY